MAHNYKCNLYLFNVYIPGKYYKIENILFTTACKYGRIWARADAMNDYIVATVKSTLQIDIFAEVVTQEWFQETFMKNEKSEDSNG